MPGDDIRVPVVLVAPAEHATLSVARQVATGIALAAGLSDDEVADVKVAVTEACTNAIRHAYPDEAPGPLTLAAWVAAGRLMLSVRDRGVGLPGEGRNDGVGLVTIAALAAEVAVRSLDGIGTEVVMAFDLAGPAPA